MPLVSGESVCFHIKARCLVWKIIFSSRGMGLSITYYSYNIMERWCSKIYKQQPIYSEAKRKATSPPKNIRQNEQASQTHFVLSLIAELSKLPAMQAGPTLADAILHVRFIIQNTIVLFSGNMEKLIVLLGLYLKSVQWEVQQTSLIWFLRKHCFFQRKKDKRVKEETLTTLCPLIL